MVCVRYNTSYFIYYKYIYHHLVLVQMLLTSKEVPVIYTQTVFRELVYLTSSYKPIYDRMQSLVEVGRSIES